MKTSGFICVKDEYGITYNVATLIHEVNEASFKYTFIPNYNIIDLIKDFKVFNGIPGINLDLRKKEYIRENILPIFIEERVPQKSRVNYLELLNEAGLSEDNPIMYLINTPYQYFGDNLFMKPYKEKETIDISKISPKLNNFQILRKLLNYICFNNDVIIDDFKIDNSNRSIIYDFCMILYKKSYKSFKKLIDDGINEAKKNHKYNGRKEKEIDLEKFNKVCNDVENKKISVSDALSFLQISKSKYYRCKSKYFKKDK